jgi:hypothetical protein
MMNLFHGAGYLFNDDRASGGKVTEADILCCRHCEKILIKTRWKEDGGWCGRCGAPVCGPCADAITTKGCTPFIKRIDEQVDRLERRQALVRGIF